MRRAVRTWGLEPVHHGVVRAARQPVLGERPSKRRAAPCPALSAGEALQCDTLLWLEGDGRVQVEAVVLGHQTGCRGLFGWRRAEELQRGCQHDLFFRSHPGAAEQCAGTGRDALDEFLYLPKPRGGRPLQHHRAIGLLFTDAVERQEMKVNVEVRGAAEMLNGRDRAGGSVLVGARRRAQGLGEFLEEQRQQLRLHVSIPREAMVQVEGHRQHPLSQRKPGQDRVDEMRRGLCGTPASAAWTEAALLAGEGDERILAAGIAVNAHEALREDAAVPVAAERLADERGNLV